jgi:hypothetical protein
MARSADRAASGPPPSPRLLASPVHEVAVTSPGPPPIPLSAPGLIGPNSILNPPWSGPSSGRRTRNRPFSHVHLEVDLKAGSGGSTGLPFWERIESVLAEREIVENADLVWLTARTLHALASRQFRRVDHWEVAPGGWLPPPEYASVRAGDAEPVGQLLGALESGGGPIIAKARSFSVRVSDLHRNRADVTVRRVHRQRRHALSVDLWGSWTKETINGLVGALADRLPLSKTTMTKYQYAVEAGPRGSR